MSYVKITAVWTQGEFECMRLAKRALYPHLYPDQTNIAASLDLYEAL
jgi:hypothetical protein